MPLDVIKETIAELVKNGFAIHPRVKISVALRTAATLVESGIATIGQMLEISRGFRYEDDVEPADVLQTRLIDCELDSDMRIRLMKEIFVKTFFGQKIRNCAGTHEEILLSELAVLESFVQKATKVPILTESVNNALYDFVEAVNAPKYDPYR